MNTQEQQATVIAISKILGCTKDDAEPISKEVAALCILALDALDETKVEILDDEDMQFFADENSFDVVAVWFNNPRPCGACEILCSATREEWLEVRNAMERDWLYNSDI